MDDADKALAAFRRLPPGMQARIRTDGLAIGNRVERHTTQILIGPPGNAAPPQEISHGSGIVMLAAGKLLLATADHVVHMYERRVAQGFPTAFQVGNLLINPQERLYWRDSDRDLALLEIRASEVSRVAAMTWIQRMWPPPVPDAGEFVAFAGYPSEYREPRGPGEVEFGLVGGIIAVTSRTGRNLKCAMPRDSLIAVKGAAPPPPGTRVGGMSGGPVFAVRSEQLDLVGVITDFGDLFDMFWMATFEEVPLQEVS